MDDKEMALKRVFQNAAGVLSGRWWESGWLRGRRGVPDGELVVVKSGLAQLDRAMGTGGLPQGHITELIGPDTGGSLSVMAKIAAKCQRKQLAVTIFDVAGQVDFEHLIRCGLVAPDLLCICPNNALDLVHQLQLAAKEEGLVVLNLGFIPATFDAIPAAALRNLMGRLRQIVRAAAATFLCVTTPEEINPLIHTNYLPEFPLNEVAAIRLWVQDEGWIRKNGDVGGYRGNITVIKNLLAESGKGANVRVPFINPEIGRLSEELGF
jgi:hypothetical protein